MPASIRSPAPLWALPFGWALVLLLLWWPVDEAARLSGDSQFRQLNLLATAAAALGAWSLAQLLPTRWMRALLVVGLLAAVCLRVLHLGLVKFSGAGFTLEFFLHLEWQSVRLALTHYPWLALMLAGLLLALGLLLWKFALRRAPLPVAFSVTSLLLASGVAAYSRAGLPEYQLLRAWQTWTSPLAAELDPARLARWESQPWLETEIVPKRMLQAYAPRKPLNLVLVYLESVGTPLITHPRWPGLMPRLASLQARHALLPAVHASSFITVEGLINSQCGSLLPFQRDSDTYASGERVFEDLPCLGDVLAKAGYAQSYLGGAGMGFAGKGAFLAAHGYENLLGYEHWQSLDMHARPGTWGLADPELFAQAEIEIARLRAQDRPFNLTLLTIGTHLPGYRYDECEAFAPALSLPQSERDFLDALHCTDQILGAFVDRLEAAGTLEDTLLVITADHHVFPNPDMRALFGAAVEDRRLPLIALGPVRERPAPSLQGAGFDLAPTLLDLLGIQHNARFMLGRSLLQPEAAERSYLPNRYLGVQHGSAAEPNSACSKDANELALPLDACSHAELLQLLAANAQRLDAPPPRLACEGDLQTGLRVNTADGLDFELWFGGQPQLRHFTWNSRPLQAPRSGLYRLSIDGAGQVSERQFVPAGISAEQRAELARAAAAEPAILDLSLLAWLPPSATPGEPVEHNQEFVSELASLLPGFDPGLHGGWWIRHGEGFVATEVAADLQAPIELWLSAQQCLDILRTNPGPAAIQAHD